MVKLPEGSLLKAFLTQRLADIANSKSRRSLEQLRAKLGGLAMTRGFQSALAAHFQATGKPGVIAELKGGSVFDRSFRRPVPYKALAEDFEAVGATCLSVAVERRVLGGSYADLATVSETVQLPVLAQDIVVDLYQVIEARVSGADAVLLAACLLGDELPQFVSYASSLALDPVVQVHTEAEIEQALAAGARCLCVTNRNIHTFELKRGTCEALLPLIPAEVLAMAEGGFGTAEGLQSLRRAGAKGVLMGTALMKDGDPAGVLAQVLGVNAAPE